jgi:D-alanyl-D-alanine carboxypeptidase
MDTAELQKLAKETRHKRETGTALVISALLLGLFLFIPIASHKTASIPVSAETAPISNAFEAVAIEAKAAIVLDLVTGEVLYENNADAQLPLASLTKLLTVYAALSELDPSSEVVISSNVIGVEAPRAFNVGQAFTLADLSRITLTASLNDGAAAIAEATAQHANRLETEMLASAAAGLGLTQTFAVNGNGLDVSAAISGGYGSARDLARLAGALAQRAPQIARATTEAFAEAVSKGGTHFRVKNTDPIVGKIPNLLLSKTGLTDLAGGNLALVFDAAINHPIAIVVLGSTETSRFSDATELLTATLSHFATLASL